MSNVLTALQPVLFSAARVVPRELIGVLGAANMNFDDRGVALGDSVKVPVMPKMTVGTFTPAATFPSGADRTAASRDLTLNQTAEVSWNLTAEEERSLINGGNNLDAFEQTMSQAFRSVANQIEAYAAQVGAQGASYAIGTPGTTPFASDLTDAALAKQLQDDAGAPMADRCIIMDTDAGVNLRSLTQLTNVNEGGTSATLRDGTLLDLFGQDIRESAGIYSHTAGTGTGYLVNSAALAIGDTEIPVDGGSNDIDAGDIITIAGDTTQYVVVSGVSGGSGTLTIGAAGLKAAPADNAAITVSNGGVRNLILQRNALAVVARPALQPSGAIAEQMIVSDPVSGLSFLVLRVPQDGQASWFVRSVYDAFLPNGEFAHILNG